MRFSIVIPTFQRRDIVLRTVEALVHQELRNFEVIVVADGCTDGTAAALRELALPLALRVLEQTNRGAAAARNAGAWTAAGHLLLFLDDDMEAHPAMLAEHDRAHREGADVVLGHLPLHPDSPPTAIAAVTGRWAERRRARLAKPGTEVPVSDLLTGQISIGRATFERLGGFDVTFTRQGQFGGEDIDFGYRARTMGLRIVFSEAAVSYQYYDVDPATYTRRSRDAGRAWQLLTVKYPELTPELARRRRFATRRSKVTLGRLATASAVVSWPLRATAIRLFSRSTPGPRSSRFFFAVQTMERIRGAHQAGRTRGARIAVVLAYHAISDLRGDRVLEEYGVPRKRFASHLDVLSKCGFRFIGLESLLGALDGDLALPRGAVLLTFDDAYADLLTAGCPVLAERCIPAVAFAVTSHLGGTNEWDRPLGAAVLPVLDADGLRAIAAQGIVIGSHGTTHRPLVGLTPPELEQELIDSAERLSSLGLPRPTVLSYAHGDWSPEVAAAVRRAGYAGAFTVVPDVVRAGAERYALPRVEVYASDTPTKLVIKLATAGWPDPWRRRLLRLLGVTLGAQRRNASPTSASSAFALARGAPRTGT